MYERNVESDIARESNILEIKKKFTNKKQQSKDISFYPIRVRENKRIILFLPVVMLYEKQMYQSYTAVNLHFAWCWIISEMQYGKWFPRHGEIINMRTKFN